MSEHASLPPPSPTTRRQPGRQRVLKVLPSSWDDVPSGPVPASVIRYFEEAIAREEARRNARSARYTD